MRREERRDRKEGGKKERDVADRSSRGGQKVLGNLSSKGHAHKGAEY